MKKNAIFLFFLFTIQFYGQDDFRYKSTKSIHDTIYVKDLADKLIVKLFVDNKIDTYNYFFKNSDEFYQLTPNVNSKISLSLDYEVIAFAVSVPKKWGVFQTDDKLKGKTKDFSFAFGFFLTNGIKNSILVTLKGFI